MLGGRYRLEEVIGSGGSGVVWRAHDEVLARPVAAKVLHRHLAAETGTVERFRREAVAAADLNHPNIVRVHDVGEDEDTSYLVMEYVDGPTLSDVLRRIGPLDPEFVAAVGYQVASALGAAHERGLIHRDMKPANVLLTSDGYAKVADFGLAKAIGAATASLTVPGTLLGTVAYLAPEQLTDVELDARVDVYGLGLVLLECLTGQPPFPGDTPPAVAAARTVGDPIRARERRPDTPVALDEALARATRRDRDERFDDGGGLAAALEPFVPEVAQQPVAALLEQVDVPVPGFRGEDSQPLQREREETQVLRPARPPTAREPDETRPVRPVASARVRRAERETPAASGTATTTTAGRANDQTDDDSRRLLTAIGVVALLVAAVATGLFLSRGGDGDEPGRAAGAEPATIDVVAAQDFDPFGGGDEHADEVPAASDGDPSTSWTTERYSSADMGGLKPGVGIWFDLGDRRDVASVEIDLATTGIDLSVHALDDEPGSDPASWGDPIHEATGAGDRVTFDVPDGRSGRYWLLWITSVGGSGGRAGIAEVRFLAG